MSVCGVSVPLVHAEQDTTAQETSSWRKGDRLDQLIRGESAFAVGNKSEAEREEVKRIVRYLSGHAAGLDVSALKALEHEARTLDAGEMAILP